MTREKERVIFRAAIKALAEEVWRNVDTDTKFKKGDNVLLKKEGVRFLIIGVNRVDKNTVEYALQDYHLLVWEEELEG